jgi:hypothetical protein
MTGLTRLELEGLRHALERVPTADSFRASAPNGLVGFLNRLRQWDQTERQPWLRRLDAFLAGAEDGGCRDGRHTSSDEGTDTSAPAAHVEADAELEHGGHGVGMANLHEGVDTEVPQGRDALQLLWRSVASCDTVAMSESTPPGSRTVAGPWTKGRSVTPAAVLQNLVALCRMTRGGARRGDQNPW